MEYDGKTEWGTYHKAFFYDENYRPCGKEDAVVAHIHEYDEDGHFVRKSIGFCNGKGSKDFKEGIFPDFLHRNRNSK